MQLVSAPFRLRADLAEVMELLAVKAREKNLELIWQVEADVADQCRGDPGRLRQIVINLVGNAIKFTEQGKVHLSKPVNINDLLWKIDGIPGRAPTA